MLLLAIKSKEVFNTRQGSLSTIDYYETLNGLWIELDQYKSLKMTCDSATLVEFTEKKFLIGLHFKLIHYPLKCV